METEDTPSGILVGGTDSGSVVLWNPVKILNGETDDAVLIQNDKHTGTYIFHKNGFNFDVLATHTVNTPLNSQQLSCNSCCRLIKQWKLRKL